MAKRFDPKKHATVSGVHELVEPKTKYSAKYEVRDKNMRRTLAITWLPFRHEVPIGGSVWILTYDNPEDKYITLDDLRQ